MNDKYPHYFDNTSEEVFFNDCPQCNFRGHLVHVRELLFKPIDAECRRESQGMGLCGHKWSLVMSDEVKQKWHTFYKARGHARMAIKKLKVALQDIKEAS